MVERIFYGSGTQQFGELRVPDGAAGRPLVVLVHGGFWRDRYHLDLMDPLADALADRGFASWNIEYRRVGPTGGGWDTTPADVAAAIDHVSAKWPTFAVAGHSAGGHLALWNASRADAPRPPALTVGLAPVADVIAANREGTGVDATPNFVGGSADEFPDRYAHVQPDPDRFAGRIVLIHGDADENVPVHQSTRLEGRVDAVHVLAGVDHFQVIDPSHESWALVFDELAALGV